MNSTEYLCLCKYYWYPTADLGQLNDWPPIHHSQLVQKYHRCPKLINNDLFLEKHATVCTVARFPTNKLLLTSFGATVEIQSLIMELQQKNVEYPCILCKRPVRPRKQVGCPGEYQSG